MYVTPTKHVITERLTFPHAARGERLAIIGFYAVFNSSLKSKTFARTRHYHFPWLGVVGLNPAPWETPVLLKVLNNILANLNIGSTSMNHQFIVRWRSSQLE